MCVCVCYRGLKSQQHTRTSEQEALLLWNAGQSVCQNVVNCYTAVELPSCAINPQHIEVMELEHCG